MHKQEEGRGGRRRKGDTRIEGCAGYVTTCSPAVLWSPAIPVLGLLWSCSPWWQTFLMQLQVLVVMATGPIHIIGCIECKALIHYVKLIS